jgi:GR25 family glycosyltransferase involved in LPS biosynthesis
MKTINDVFSRVIVINLDRRPDRYRAVQAELDVLGIRAARFAAVDGKDRKVLAEWKQYAAEPLVALRGDEPPALTYRQFHLEDKSARARVAFVEQRDGKKAIATAGAWGLLLSMTEVIEQAVAEAWPSLLILEDDALFHKDTTALFDHVLGQLPADWAILQLGAMQLHWEPSWITWHSKNLYRCNGSSMAAHAVGLRQEVLPALLQACRMRDLPFDIGALHVIKRQYRDRCFTCFPNLVIQDATDSEIGMSTIFFREARQQTNIYRWQISHYGLDAIKAQMDRPGVPGNGRVASSMLGTLRHLQARLRAKPVGPASASSRSAIAPPADGESLNLRDPPLVPFVEERPNARVVLVLAIEVVREQLPGLLDMIDKTSRDDDVVPIVVTDYADFLAFRERGLIFEYLPDVEQQKAHAPELAWNLYELRRLALLRRKWRPANAIAFGARGTTLLRQWQASPFW